MCALPVGYAKQIIAKTNWYPVVISISQLRSKRKFKQNQTLHFPLSQGDVEFQLTFLLI